MVDPTPDNPAPAHPPPGPRRITRPLLLAGVILGGVLLCVLLSVWSLVEVIAHANGNWDPPPLHTRVPTETPISTAGAVLPRPPTEAPATAGVPALAATATPVLPTVGPPATATATRVEMAALDASATPVPTASSTPATAIGAPADPAHPLLGHRIALDPGHGPREDLGAVYVDPQANRLVLSEDVVNLDVAQRTRALLEARGAAVALTREETAVFATPWPDDANGDGLQHEQADDLQWRIDEMNAFKAEVYLSIHTNSHADPNKRQGIQTLACITTGCPFLSQNLRVENLVLDHLQTELAGIGYPVAARELRNDLLGDPPGHLFISGPAELPKHPRGIAMPGATVEALYITSPSEMQQLQLPSVRQAIARAYADALQEYLLIPPPIATP